MTAGQYWHKRDNWMDDSMHYCFWRGITCNEDGFVTSIGFWNNNVTGCLPRLDGLKFLQALCLSINKINCRLRDFISVNMTQMVRLTIPNNKLRGDLHILGSLVNLRLIQLTQNRDLIGTLPRAFCSMSTLQVLSLGETGVSGQIPHCLGYNNPILRFLDLEYCPRLNSTFPESLTHLVGLQWLHMTHANIHGTLPLNFGLYYGKLSQLLLAHNFLKGGLPCAIGNMTRATEIDLSFNHFEGQLLSSLVALPKLYGLFLQNNSFSLLPNNQTVSRELDTIDISGNKFNTTLGNLLRIFQPGNRIHTMKLSDTGLHGRFSASIWTFSYLTSLDVSFNFLSGKLPTVQNAEIPYLATFNLKNNNFTGRIPENFRQLGSLTLLDLSNNPHMKSETDMPDSREFTWNLGDLQIYAERNFTCPAIFMQKSNDGHCQVMIDPSYFSYRYCHCDVNNYGYAGVCHPCWVNGGRCGAIHGFDIHTLNTTYYSINAKTTNDERFEVKMFWPTNMYPGNNDTKTFDNCSFPTGGVMVCNPYGNCTCSLNYSKSDNKYVTVCDENCLCNAELKLKGRRCLECIDENYFKDGNRCHPCFSGKNHIAFLCVSVVLVIGMMLFSIWGIYRSRRSNSDTGIIVFKVFLLFVSFMLCLFHLFPFWLFQLMFIIFIFGIHGVENKCVGLIKIFVFYVQTLDVILHTFPNLNLDFLFRVEWFLQTTLNFHFSNFGCYWRFMYSPFGKLIITAILPIIVLLVCILMILINKILTRCKQRRGNVDTIDLANLNQKLFKHRCFGFFMFVSNVLYFPIVKQTLSAISNCKRDPLDNEVYMERIPTIKCYSDTHHNMVLVGWLALIVEVIGFWVMCAALLFAYNRKYQYIQNHMFGERKETELKYINSLLSPLLEPYKDYRFIELLFLAKRVIIACTVTMVDPRSIFHPVILLSILMFSLAMQITKHPFKYSGSVTLCHREIPLNFENVLYEAVLLMLQMTVIGGSSLTMHMESFYSSVSARSFIICVVVANISVLLALVLAMVARIVGVTRKKRRIIRDRILLDQ